MALTQLAEFNAVVGTHFSDDEYETIGGMLLQRFERVPKRGDRVTIDDFSFEILRADSRRVHAILVTRAAR
jgi:magnesium and cobalt transporter